MQKPPANTWSPRARRIASVLLAFHVSALFVAPWSMPPPASLLSRDTAAWYRPYLHGVFIYHGYRFFAPEPGPSHLVRYELQFADGTTRLATFPDLARHQPRLRYHRHFMLSEIVHQMTNLAPEPVPPPRDLPPQVLRQANENFALAQRDYATAIRRREMLLRPLAQRLLLENDAQRVRLFSVEHRIPSPQEVIDGLELSDPRLYLARPIGEFHRDEL